MATKKTSNDKKQTNKKNVVANAEKNSANVTVEVKQAEVEKVEVEKVEVKQPKVETVPVKKENASMDETDNKIVELVKLLVNLGWSVSPTSKREKDTYVFKLANKSLQLKSNNTSDLIPEIIIHKTQNAINPVKILIGMYKTDCENNLILAIPGIKNVLRIDFENITPKHASDLTTKATNIFQICFNYINVMKSVTLDHEQMEEFAINALISRDVYLFKGTIEENIEKVKSMYDINDLIKANRPADNVPTLWATYNNIQEKLLETGFERKLEDGKKSKMSAIKSIARNISQNLRIFNFASDYVSPDINKKYEKILKRIAKGGMVDLSILDKDLVNLTHEDLTSNVEHAEHVENVEHVENIEHVEHVDNDVKQANNILDMSNDPFDSIKDVESIEDGMLITSNYETETNDDVTETYDKEGNVITKRTVITEKQKRLLTLSKNSTPAKAI